MVNTVGSYETKYWHKKWIPIKKALGLNSKQRALIIGSLLGDGTMRIGKGARNANFKSEHCLKQKAYVKWKYQTLKPFVSTRPKISYRYDEEGNRYKKSWWFRTLRHPILTRIYKEFYTGNGYKTGRKIIPSTIKQEMNPLVLAVWIMDDGSYQKGRIDISTYSFSLKEINRLQEALLKVFNVEARYYKDRDKGFRMYFNQENTRRVIEVIRLYIIPSMRYKIGVS